MPKSAWLPAAWTPATIAVMVLGFVVFWPLGLAMLVYIIFGRRSSRNGQAAEKGLALPKSLKRLRGPERRFEHYSSEERRAEDREDFFRFMRSRRKGRDTKTQTA